MLFKFQNPRHLEDEILIAKNAEENKLNSAGFENEVCE